MPPPVDPANIVQALFFTLLDVFEAARDLHQTLSAKEKRDWSKGYADSRRVEYIERDEVEGEESIVMDKAAVTRQFDNGYRDNGPQFAMGDAISQTALQSQIITLQSVIITTFLYGPTSAEPISRQLSSLVAASRAAGTAAVDILAAQNDRQFAAFPPAPRSTRQSPSSRGGLAPPLHPPLPYPVTSQPSVSSASTALVKARRESTPLPAKTTILDTSSRPRAVRSDTETTSFSGPTSYGEQMHPHNLFCLYALDLQNNPSQPLAGSITSKASPYCPHCKRDLNLSPGKSWEIFKDDDRTERTFRIQNRFVVKCHRDGPDGAYSCVICSKSTSVETVCGDVKALVRHIWMDHSAAELEAEEDIAEVIEVPKERRRDSGMSWSDSRSSRRSQSLNAGKGKGRRRFERSVETLEIRPPRREPAP